jgi:hypothetical protein
MMAIYIINVGGKPCGKEVTNKGNRVTAFERRL